MSLVPRKCGDFRGLGVVATWDIDIPEGTDILDLRYNKLEYVEDLPEHIIELRLGWNRLTNIEGFRFNNGLMKLDLSGNDIKSLRGVDFPDTLFEINLGDNLIEDLVGVKFPTGLKRLLLCKNKLTNFEEVQFPSGLRHLGLAVNYISDLSLCSIEFPQELQILDLRANVYLNCLSKVRLPHNLLEIDLSCNNFLREMAYMYFPESLKEMRYEECYLGYRNEVYDIYLPWGVDIKNSYARRQLCYAKCDFVSRAILKKVKYARFAPSAWWVRISYMLGGVVFQEYDSAFYKYFTI